MPRQRQAKPENTRPKFHGHINKDTIRILQHYGPDPETVAIRKDTLQKLRTLVQSHAGPAFDVYDASFYTYALDLDSAPMEFAIIDHQHPNGLQAGQPVPNLYDPSFVARILTEAGFTGGFLVPPTKSDKSPGRTPKKAAPLQQRSLTTPWPAYSSAPRTELVYPTTLQSESPAEFSITLPGPTVLALLQFIRSSLVEGRQLASLFSLAWLWVRSHGMREIMPTALALMVIHFMRTKRDARNLLIGATSPPLFNSDRAIAVDVLVDHQYRDPAFFKAQSREVKQYLHKPHQVSIAFIDSNPPVAPNLKVRVGGLFAEFLSFWRDFAPNSGHIIASIRHGANIERTEPLLKYTELEERAAADEEQASKATLPDHQPSAWRNQRLVLADPFVPTYNHAEMVARETVEYLGIQAGSVAKGLMGTHPLTSIFGKFGTSPRRSFHSTAHAPNVQNLDVDVPEAIQCSRAQTVQKVQDAIANTYGNQYRVEAFGSTRYGVSQASSDLDLVVLDPARMNGHSPSAPQVLPKIYDVKALASVLSRAGFTRVLAIPSAVVPIVKIFDPVTRLDCDININEQLGLLNTGLVKKYCDLQPVLRPMIVYLKRWAKSHNMNSPSSRWGEPVSFSSYALVLMTIGYLQTRQLLPNLQANLGPLPKGDIGSHWVKAPHGKMLIECDVRFSQAEGWVSPPADVDEALRGWLAFWSSGFDYEKQMMSIRHGGLIPRPKPKRKVKNVAAAPVDKLVEETAAPADTVAEDVGEVEVSGEGAAEVAETVEAARDEVEAALKTTQGASTSSEVFDGRLDLSQHETQNVSEDMPPVWARHAICVIDPFIRARNVAQNLVAPTVTRFALECQRAEMLLKWGAGLDDLVVSNADMKDANPPPYTENPQYDNRPPASRPQPPRNPLPRDPRPRHGGPPQTVGRVVAPPQADLEVHRFAPRVASRPNVSNESWGQRPAQM